MRSQRVGHNWETSTLNLLNLCHTPLGEELAIREVSSHFQGHTALIGQVCMTPTFVLLTVCYVACLCFLIHSVCLLVTQLCLTLCHPTDCSPPGFSVHGILQEIILEWVAMPFFRDLPDPVIESSSPVLQADSLPTELPVFSHGLSDNLGISL